MPAIRLAVLLAGALALLTLAAPPALAQNDEPVEVGPVPPGTWRAYPAMRRVQAAVGTADAVWAGTDGGVFRYDPASGQIERFTTADGLARRDVRALVFDDARQRLWIGYADGTLDRLDTNSGTITAVFDIARADRFQQRGINRLRILGDSLYAATEFGVVVVDLTANVVRDTYERFGGFERARPVHDVLPAPRPDGSDGLWVATQDGVAHAPRRSPSLQAPDTWTADATAPRPALALGLLGGSIHLGQGAGGTPAQPGLYRLGASGWTRLPLRSSTAEVFDLVPYGGELLAASNFDVEAVAPSGAVRGLQILLDEFQLALAVGPEGELWSGRMGFGLARLPDPATFDGTPAGPDRLEFVTPGGPLTNNVLALDVGPEGELVVGYRGISFPSSLRGMSRFDGTRWHHASPQTGQATVPRGNVISVLAARDGTAWGGTEGNGLIRFGADGSIAVFDETNSPLTVDPTTNMDFVVVTGLAEDSRGDVWITTRNGSPGLFVWDGERFIARDRPSGIPPQARRYRGLIIDRFDQKWTPLLNTNEPRGLGFAVTRTPDRENPAQDEALAITGAGSATTGTGLPDADVRTMVEDLDGRIWIGTGRGLAVITSPGSVFSSPGLLTPAWARTPEQDAYFLRDLTIFDMAVDPAGRKWLASNSGAWLINAAGNEVIAQFTEQNSPLPSNLVVGVSVDAPSGTVYFATDGGLVSYRGDSVAPSARAEPLRVYPSPFRPAQDPFVHVEGLVAETRVRILTLDGQAVASFDARGGSISWDGRDQRTGRIVPSGVYLVAAAGTNGQGTAYGRIAVIH